jgi:hypothetical protein
MRVVVRSGPGEGVSVTTSRSRYRDGDDVLTFLLKVDGETCITFENDMHTGLGISFCDRRSIDGGEGEEEGRESRCDRVCTHFDLCFLFWI